ACCDIARVIWRRPTIACTLAERRWYISGCFEMRFSVASQLVIINALTATPNVSAPERFERFTLRIILPAHGESISCPAVAGLIQHRPAGRVVLSCRIATATGF